MKREALLKSRATILRGDRQAATRPVIAFLPGGPGLSSHTLEGVEVLRRSFDLALIDPPGTGGLPSVNRPTFDAVVASIGETLRELQRPVVVAGHSFGGYFALGCADRGDSPISGLVLISTPLTPESYAAATSQYERHKDAALAASEKRWESEHSAEAFRQWVASYGPLFFGAARRERGREMLLQDRTSHESCLSLAGLMSDRDFSQGLLAKARRFAGPKLFIAGEDDLLYPVENLRRDAASVSMPFVAVAGAGHFPPFENPEAVARAFERTFLVHEKQEAP